MFTLTLSSYFGSPGSQGENWLHINVEINWQLSKQGICWPVSPDCIAHSGVDPSRSSIFLKLPADKSLVFKWSQAQVYFLKIHMKYVVFMSLWPHTINIFISNWPGMCKQRRQMLFTFLTIVTHWSCSTSNFYALIGQNLTGEFMQKLESCLLWQLKLTEFLSTCDAFNCLFPLDVQNEIQPLSMVFCYSWLVCLLNFWFRNAPLVKVGNLISDSIVFVFTLLHA